MQQSGDFIGHYACIDCSSSDAMAVYKKQDGTYDATCFSHCKSEGKSFKSHNRLADFDVGQKLGIEKISSRKVKIKLPEKQDEEKRSSSVSILSDEQNNKIKEISTLSGRNYRKLKDKYNTYFGVRTEYDENTGEPSKRYYPVTEGSDTNNKPNLTGYKVRDIEAKKYKIKDRIPFYPIGELSKKSDFFGQWRCRGISKYILIVGGEEDTVAAFQMLREDQIRRGKNNYPVIDVISCSIGESSTASQAKLHYEFLDQYENIILGLDNDEAGHKATQALLDVLPMGKVRVMQNPAKDACDCLDEGLESEFVSAFYSSKKPKLAGIVSSCDLHERILEIAASPLIPLPHFVKKLIDMLVGGLPFGEIINILAKSGIGKTTIINEFIYYWIFNSPYKPGILSLEASAGKYGEKLLSRHLEINLSRIKDRQSKLNYLKQPEVIEKANKMYFDEEGNERFALVDDRGELDTIEEVKKKISHLIRGCGCKLIIIDPLQDILDALTIEEQADFCSWQKKIKSQEGVTFVNINHARKSGSNARNSDISEEDMQGTSAIFKSGAVNIIVSRDKLAEDLIDRNTQKWRLDKNRDGGVTGPAGETFYEMETHTLHDKDTYNFQENY